MYDKIDGLLQKYITEAERSVTDTAPSALKRGEGTLCDYYILKIDLCGSTEFLKRKHHTTYLRFAHVFLSTIDHITQEYGAESTQNEYAGDSVIAYFPCDAVDAFDVLLAAHYCRHAASQMKDAYPSFRGYEFETKVVLHKTKLVISKIGPWGGHRVTAIGYGIHQVCKVEQKLESGHGRTTMQFADALGKPYSRFVSANYIQEATVAPSPTPAPKRSLMDLATILGSTPTSAPSYRGLLGQALAQPSGGGIRRLSDFAVTQPATTNAPPSLASFVTESASALPVTKTLVDYSICWGPLRMYTLGKIKL